jgi:hypothetical protein
MSTDEQLSIEEGKAIVQAGLGRYELDLVTSFCAPIYWAVRDAFRSVRSRNGTAFFLDAGQGLFGVTACHVIDGWQASRAGEDAGPLRLAGNGTSVLIEIDRAAIAMDREIDIATFRVTEADVKSLGKNVLTGHQKTGRQVLHRSGAAYITAGTLGPARIIHLHAKRFSAFALVRASPTALVKGMCPHKSSASICCQQWARVSPRKFRLRRGQRRRDAHRHSR